MTSYLTASDARTLAATLPANLMTALLALSDDQLNAVLLAASIDIDNAQRYQGRKFNLTQEREFPRVAFGPPALINQFGVQTAVAGQTLLTPDTVIWDWDSTNNVAAVPNDVLVACLYQAAWSLQPQYAARLEQIRSGLAAQSIGSASETYLNPQMLAAMATGLGDKANRIMQKYRLRSGRLL